MIRKFLLLLCIVVAAKGNAQTLIPFEFISEEENRFIKENDSCKFYASSGDSSDVVSLNEEANYYKLLNKAKKVIAEGSYIAEGEKYLQTGKWIERYDNGKPKITGCYRRNKPIGTWQEFHPSGKVKIIANYALIINERGSTTYCLSGSWQEYYPDGKLKVNGYYSSTEMKAADTITVDDPITDQKVMKISARSEYNPVKVGTWEYYTETGELDKTEEF